MKISRHELLLRKLPELYEVRALEDLPIRMVELISALVPANLIGHNEVNLKESKATLRMSPDKFDFTPLIKVFEAHLVEHPLIRYQQKTNDLSPRKISDFLSVTQFHRLGIYNELYRQIECEDQIAFALRSSPAHIIALALNRERRSFTDEDLGLLRLLQPHLICVHQNALALTALQQRLSAYNTLLETLPLGLVVLDRRSRIQFATRHARELFRCYFKKKVNGKTLPDELCRWLAQAGKSNVSLLPPTSIKTFRIFGAGGHLSVRAVAGNSGGGFFLMLEETATTPSAPQLRVLGLTSRETEVLFWVAQGKSNSEIGIILGSATRTVQKHLEHIFLKLGVESRTAAAQRAWEILKPGLC